MATQTTSSLPDSELLKYRDFGLTEAQKLYQADAPNYYAGQTYVGPSDDTSMALDAARNRALAGNPLLPAAQRQQQDVIEGKFLKNNPYFEDALRGAGRASTQTYNDAIARAQSGASMAGRYGSNVSADIQNRAATTLADSLTNRAGELMYRNFSDERGRQDMAAGRAPELANADYNDIEKLYKVGQSREDYQRTALDADINRFNFEENKPYAKLKTYMDSVNQSPTGTVSNVQQSGGSDKIVCTAMNSAYGFGSFRQAIWLQHSANMKNAKTIEAGYHALFLPVVAYAFNEKRNALRNALRVVAEHIARHRTADLWKEMRGKKRDTLGRIYRAIIEPVCYLVGKAKGV